MELCAAFGLDGIIKAVTKEWLFMDNRKRESIIITVKEMKDLIRKM